MLFSVLSVHRSWYNVGVTIATLVSSSHIYPQSMIVYLYGGNNLDAKANHLNMQYSLPLWVTTGYIQSKEMVCKAQINKQKQQNYQEHRENECLVAGVDDSFWGGGLGEVAT